MVHEGYWDFIKAFVKNGQFHLTWKNFSEENKMAKVYVATTNNIKYGSKDQYRYLGTVKLKDEATNFAIEKESPFYKILLETPHHHLNTWITLSKENN